MIDTILYFLYYALVLVFGILLSAAFSGITYSKKSFGILLALVSICGILQITVFLGLGEAATWKLYPLITHLPTGLIFCLVFKIRIPTALASISCAYLCCQPSKWFGILLESVTDSYITGQLTQILTLLAVGFICIYYFSSYISELYNKDNRSILIFCGVPVVYYLFDYLMGIYTDLWINNNRVTMEFLPFFLCMTHLIFCMVYYKEYEKKADAERNEQITRITVDQQKKELEAIKKSHIEARILRHDMRFLLDNISASLENGDTETARRMISEYRSQIDSTSVQRYCENDTINYVLTNFHGKCQELGIVFDVNVKIKDLFVDEILFSSIISNALDNAVNAQKELHKDKRHLLMVLKTSDGKLLLSVKNPYQKKPTFVNGLPVSDKKGHGYGVQSIRYMTERLGGKCQFSVQDNHFVVRVII